MKLRFRPETNRVLLLLVLSGLGLAGVATARAQSTNTSSAPAPPTAEERARLREELQRLTPEQRRERIRALRSERATPAPAPPAAQERRRELLLRKIAELRQKQQTGTLSPPERTLLERLERALAQRDAARATNSPPPTGDAPPARTNTPPHPHAAPTP